MARRPIHDTGGSNGPATDAFNLPVIDPTKNVLDLVDAAVRRQDDLRSQSDAYNERILSIRFEHARELRQAESARIDAIRAVDVGNVARAQEVAAAQATALATQLANSAEALRAQVEATRISTASTLAAALEPIQKDVTELRQVQFQQQGERAQVAENRSELHASTADQHSGAGLTQGWVYLIALIAIAVISFLAAHYR